MAGRYGLLLLAAVFLLVYLLPLGARPLVAPDETRYAEIPREMLASGDWVVPRAAGLRYFEKPVLGYWISAASLSLFGENAFALRLPSALATGLTALILFFLVRRFGGGRDPALLAALAYLSCVEVMVLGVIGLLDAPLTLFLTGALVSFFAASRAERGSPRERGFLTLFGLLCGLAFLTKGFLAFAVPALAVGPFLVWEGRGRDLIRMAWIPLAVAILVALPWGLLVHLREPDFWRHFFWHEHLERFTAKDFDHHSGFWDLFLVLPLGALPWTALAPAALAGLRRSDAEHSLLRLAACWLVFPFLFFSASSGKLETYILPCFAPLSLLLALGLHAGAEAGRHRLRRAGTATLAAVLLLGTAGFALAVFRGLGGEPLYARGWPAALGLAALAANFLLLLASARQRRGARALLLFALAPVPLLASVTLLVPDAALERKCPGALLERNADRIGPDSILVADDDALLSVSWYYRREDVFQLGRGGELMYGLGHEDARHRLLNTLDLGVLARQHPGRVVLVSKIRDYGKVRPWLPPPSFEDRSGERGFVFVEY
jgi:4-amino-4-deoxy-L-arabinose transferase